MAFTKVPLTKDSLPSINEPASENTLPEIIVKPEPENDHDIELKEAIGDFIKNGPEYIRNMTPQQLEEMRQELSNATFQGGSAKTLVLMTEAMKEASDGLREPESKELLEEELDKSTIPVTAGQAVDLTKMIGSLMCRVADQKLKQDIVADEATLSQVKNSPDEPEARRNVENNQALRQRLDMACP